MNRLVPEQRTDATGRTQTRWVLPSAIARGKVLPAPALKADGTGAEVLPFILGYVGDDADSRDSALLQQCGPAVLERLAETLRSEGAVGKGFVAASGRWYRLTTHLHWAMVRLRQGDRAPLRNLAVLYDAVSGPEWLTASHNLWELIDGLTYPWGGTCPPPFSGVEDFSALTEDRLGQARAVLYAAHRLGDDFTEGRGDDPDDSEDTPLGDGPLRHVIHDAAMVRLVMSRPGDVEEIVRTVEEEKIIDVRLIRERLESPSRALSSGVL